MNAISDAGFANSSNLVVCLGKSTHLRAVAGEVRRKVSRAVAIEASNVDLVIATRETHANMVYRNDNHGHLNVWATSAVYTAGPTEAVITARFDDTALSGGCAEAATGLFRVDNTPVLITELPRSYDS